MHDSLAIQKTKKNVTWLAPCIIIIPKYSNRVAYTAVCLYLWRIHRCLISVYSTVRRNISTYYASETSDEKIGSQKALVHDSFGTNLPLSDIDFQKSQSDWCHTDAAITTLDLYQQQSRPYMCVSLCVKLTQIA